MDKSAYMKWGVNILIPILIFLVPVNDIFTMQMKLFLVITVASILLYTFEQINSMFVSLLMPFAWFMSGVAPLSVGFSGWVSDVPYLAISVWMFSNVLTEIGLLQRIAYSICAKAGSFKSLIILLVIAGMIITLLTFGVGYILVAALALGICQALDIKPGKTMTAIGFAVIIGAVSSRVYIYSPVMLALLISNGKSILGDTFDITPFTQMGQLWPLVLSAIVCIWFILKFYGQGENINTKEYFREKLQQMGPLSKAEKKGIIVLVILIAGVLLQPLHGISTSLILIIIPWLCFIPGIAIGSDGAVKRVPYETVFFMVGCFGIGSVAVTTGIGEAISSAVMPLLNGGSVFTTLGIVIALVSVLNFLMTPLAIMAAITMPLTQLALDLNLNPMLFMWAIFVGCDVVIMPYEYAVYLIIYGFGMMNLKEFIKLNALRSLVMIACFFIVLIPYWYLIGLI